MASGSCIAGSVEITSLIIGGTTEITGASSDQLLGGATPTDTTLATQLAVKSYITGSAAKHICCHAFSYTVPSGTSGGDTAANAWTVLPFNTEEVDCDCGKADCYINLVGSQFTVSPGKYCVHLSTVFPDIASFRVRLFNVTDDVPIAYGLSRITIGGEAGLDISAMFTAEKVIEFQYWSSDVVTNGLGLPVSITDVSEVYRRVNFFKCCCDWS